MSTVHLPSGMEKQTPVSPMERLVGLERLTIDCYFEGIQLPPTLRKIASKTGCEFVGQRIWKQLMRAVPQNAEWEAGGNVGNALMSYASALIWKGMPANAEWWGCYDESLESRAALRQFQEIGIPVHGWQEADATTYVAVVSGDPSGQHRLLIRLGIWPPGVTEKSGESCFTLLIGLDSLADPDRPVAVSAWQWCKSVVLMVNHEILDREDVAEIVKLSSQGRLALVVGTDKELQALSRRMGHDVEKGISSWNCDVIATMGERGLIGFCAANGSTVPVDSKAVARDRLVSTLGAGDTIAGTFLAERASGTPFEQALEAAVGAAAEALTRKDPRPDWSGLLQKKWEESPLAGILPEVRSIRTELDWGSGPTIISGGQTGIDQLALSAASVNALPSHAILPAGLRTETGSLLPVDFVRMGSPRLHELSETSYRTRTWAAAFVGDGTLLWQNTESSGTIETRKACRILARPLFEMSEATDEQIRRCLLWLKEFDIRILNIAGHRGSLLSDDSREAAERTLRTLIQLWAEQYASERSNLVLTSLLGRIGEPSPNRERSDIRLAIPSSGAMRAYVLDRLGIELERPRLSEKPLYLKTSVSGLSVCSGRVRDMGSWLRRGLIDAAIGGLDELVEGGAAGEVLHDFGSFQSSILLLEPAEKRDMPKPWEILSQQPRLARRLLQLHPEIQSKMKPIRGCAEAWLRMGVGSAVVDTWHTGATARSNGLKPILKLGSTSLCMVGRTTIPAGIVRSSTTRRRV